VSKIYRWTVEIDVAEVLVADGFDLTPDRLQRILEHALPYARSTEVRGRVLKSPDPGDINEEQGYPRDHKR
jgi:hypothetical protein